MNTSEIINQIANDKHLPKKDVKVIIEAYHSYIQAELFNGGKYTIQGFGTFTPKTRAAKKGRNPQTGAAVDIPEHKTVTFKPSPNYIKHCLNGHFTIESQEK